MKTNIQPKAFSALTNQRNVIAVARLRSQVRRRANGALNEFMKYLQGVRDMNATFKIFILAGTAFVSPFTSNASEARDETAPKAQKSRVFESHAKPVQVSAAQIRKFADVFVENARPAQSTYNRLVISEK